MRGRLEAVDPDGRTWLVQRRLLPWRPARRRSGADAVGDGVDAATGVADSLLAAVVLAVVVPVVVLLTLFLAEVLALLLVLPVVLALRILFRRPWRVEVRDPAEPAVVVRSVRVVGARAATAQAHRLAAVICRDGLPPVAADG